MVYTIQINFLAWGETAMNTAYNIYLWAGLLSGANLIYALLVYWYEHEVRKERYDCPLRDCELTQDLGLMGLYGFIMLAVLGIPAICAPGFDINPLNYDLWALNVVMGIVWFLASAVILILAIDRHLDLARVDPRHKHALQLI